MNLLRNSRQPRVFLFLFLLCSFPVASLFAGETTSTLPRRIVSLAPSATEILFELGLGDKVVGVTRFCDYPTSAATRTKVGGLMDMNYEAIVSLRPDLVVLLKSQRDNQRELDKVKINSLQLPHENVADIHASIRTLGDRCGAPVAAQSILDNLSSRTAAVQNAVSSQKKPRVLVCVGRDVESEGLGEIYVAGRHTFYEEIIEAAGGVNAYEDEKITYPRLAAESVVRINPDVIVDLISMKPGAKTPEEIARTWSSLNVVNAVREKKVFVISGNYALRPGPRYAEFLEELAHLLHPDVVPGVQRHG